MEQNVSSSYFHKKKFPTLWIVYTALLAGTLDILAAILLTYVSSNHAPIVVLKYIASGVLGKGAFTGGLRVALFGLLLHYIIAFIWTIVLFLIYPTLSGILRNPYVIALFY